MQAVGTGQAVQYTGAAVTTAGVLSASVSRLAPQTDIWGGGRESKQTSGKEITGSQEGAALLLGGRSAGVKGSCLSEASIASTTNMGPSAKSTCILCNQGEGMI